VSWVQRSDIRARSGILALLATAAVSFVVLDLHGDEAPAQSGGCGRCGAPTVSPTMALPVPLRTTFERPERQKRWALGTSLRVSARRETWGAYKVCVRTCDGSFFPVSYSGGRTDAREEVCRALCPNAEMALYSFPFGGTIEEATSASGEPYSNLPNAGRFEKSFDPNCSCRRPGESWADALAAAEVKYGRSHSSEIPVSIEAAERMSRPVQDPAPTPADAPDQNLAPSGQPPPGLDANGVDMSLSAATATISRESSGIFRDEVGQRPTSYDLKQGQTIDETAPDGSVHRVRVLPSTF